MFFPKESTQRRVEDFKDHLRELIATRNIKQSTIAHSMLISQPCVNSWMDPDSDRNMPAALITELPAPLPAEILRYLGEIINVRVNYELNGQIDDEVTDLADKVGQIVRLYRKDKTQKIELSLLAEEAQTIIERMKKEWAK